jgi:hypothetical protein
MCNCEIPDPGLQRTLDPRIQGQYVQVAVLQICDGFNADPGPESRFSF